MWFLEDDPPGFREGWNRAIDAYNDRFFLGLMKRIDDPKILLQDVLDATNSLVNIAAEMPYYPGSDAYKMWGRLSSQWAKGASGEVHVFQNASTGVDLQSIWRVYEYPALRANPKVTNIIFHY